MYSCRNNCLSSPCLQLVNWRSCYCSTLIIIIVIIIKCFNKQDNVRTNTESVQCHLVSIQPTWLPLYEVMWRHRLRDHRFAIGQFLLVVHWNWSSISCRFKIFASKYIWLTILTFWGRLMLSVIWDNGPQTFWSHDPDLSRSRDVIGHMAIELPISHFLFVPHCDQAPISSFFSRYWALKIIGSRPWPL